MPQSVKQQIDLEIEKLEADVMPKLMRLTELKSARAVIDSMPIQKTTINVEPTLKKGAGSSMVRRVKKHKSRSRYGDKTLPEYITEIGKTLKPFSAKDIRLEIKKRYGFNVKHSSISAAMSIMNKHKKTLRRIRLGVYTLGGKP